MHLIVIFITLITVNFNLLQFVDKAFAQMRLYKPPEVTEQEAFNYYTNNRHQFSKENTGQACVYEIVVNNSVSKLRDLQTKIDKGEQFEKVAEKFSESRSAKEQGWIGCKDRFWFGIRGDEIFSLKPGQISDIMKHPNGGLCIYKVKNFIPGRDIPYIEAKPIIVEKLQRDKNLKSQSDNYKTPEIKLPPLALPEAKIEAPLSITPLDLTINKCNIEIQNITSEPVLVKIIGPNRSENKIEAFESIRKYVDDGKYYIKIRYGSDANKYRYEKGESFDVKRTNGKLTTTTIKLLKSEKGSYRVSPIGEREFNSH